MCSMIMSADEDEPLSEEALNISLAAAEKDKAPDFPICESIQSVLDVLTKGKVRPPILPISEAPNEDPPADYDTVYKVLDELNGQYKEIYPISNLILKPRELHEAAEACLILGMASPEQITEGV